jgi:chromosome segregation ATPase
MLGDSSSDPMLSADVDALRLEILRLRDLLAGAEARAGELSTRLERLEANRVRSEELWQVRVANTEHELAIARDHELAHQAILSSTSWRVGRAIVSPFARLRQFVAGR